MEGMRRAVLFEVRRVTSVGSTWILLGLIFLVGLATSLNQLRGETSAADFPLGAVNHLTAGGVVAAAVGASAIGAELRWNTLRALYTAFPRRTDIVLAKVGVVVVLLVALSIVCTVVDTVVTSVAAGGTGFDGAWFGLGTRSALVLVCWGVIGFSVAALTRSQVAGFLVPVAVAYIVEIGLLSIFPSNTLASVLPFINASEATSVGIPAVEAFERAAVFGGWAVVLLVAAVVVLRRRDA
ncbi:ABC transporter permease subunit [Cellulomonas sp. Leaf334]|uniref:ABC transporter permease subunit n=1 Tax=Cellulomonas sp. Leaf334 TaxID=1736339 RepID=UPI0006F8B80A|nr:ABC transporter permease subunit [Cellulomonas sp. Leaf334]KQR07264.1 hypothetical protein ASF78_21405 [Cellulomonas sp. Leaf334]